LKKVDIELGRFTVITGASSSGKSAFMRAVRALSSNVRGSSAITVGEKSMSVSAYTDKNIITLQRTGAAGKYLLVDRSTGEEQKYTKLAQKVPDDITQALRILPVTKDQASINFAGQHDLPYLLGETASQVARVLGDLTNVSTIFEAVREAIKKKTSTSSLLKTRQSDFDLVLEQAQEFSGLREKIVFVDRAEELLEEISEQEGILGQLELLVASLERSEALLSTYKALPDVPSFDSVETSYSFYREAKAEITKWAKANIILKESHAGLEDALVQEEQAHLAFHAKLEELGTCPTCGQEIK
jgi:DNA repair ATPase RecN